MSYSVSDTRLKLVGGNRFPFGKDFSELFNHNYNYVLAMIYNELFFAIKDGSDNTVYGLYQFNNIIFGQSLDEMRDGTKGEHGKEICQFSVPQAINCFLLSTGFEDCIRNCISIGGDSDTIACIAGGVAEAFYGGGSGTEVEKIWSDICDLNRAEDSFYDEIDSIFEEFYSIC